MGVFYFPCNFVYWRKPSKHEIYKSKITETIDSNRHNFLNHELITNGCRGSNNVGTEIIKKNKELIDDVVWNTIDEMFNVLNARENTVKMDISNSIIQKSWVSIYNEKSTMATHEHYDHNVVKLNGVEYRSCFVLVYIVKDPNERNTTVFTEPYMLAKTMYGMRQFLFDTSLNDEIGEGTVLIFPSSLHHHVKLMEKPGRIIMSFNVYSDVPV
jgi:hypothetical protein